MVALEVASRDFRCVAEATLSGGGANYDLYTTQVVHSGYIGLGCATQSMLAMVVHAGSTLVVIRLALQGSSM